MRRAVVMLVVSIGLIASAGGSGALAGTDHFEKTESMSSYYQADLVEGQPTADLLGIQSYYTDRLIRFVEGSGNTSVTDRSDGEYTTDEELRRCVESEPIDVSNDTASVAVAISAECDPIELSLVSYEKPAPGPMATAETVNSFSDTETRTLEPGENYQFRVDLPATASENTDETESDAEEVTLSDSLNESNTTTQNGTDETVDSDDETVTNDSETT